jgi:hypothetical protein
MVPMVSAVAAAAFGPEFAVPPHAVRASAALTVRAVATALGPNFIVGSLDLWNGRLAE